MVLLLRLLVVAAGLALAAATASGAATAGTAASPTGDFTRLSSSMSGFEVPPVSSTLGTFVGVADAAVRYGWRAQIEHVPLSRGSTVPITGGSFKLVSMWGRKLKGAVTGGSVAVLDRGDGCRDQRYRVVVATSMGRFAGVLVHNRRSLIGQCLITSASIRGQGAFTVPEGFTRSRLP